jgi:Nitrile hydratase, alpha chain
MAKPKMTPAMQSAWSQVIARSWSDDSYKQRLVENPKEVLSEAGISVPQDTRVVVHENQPGEQHLVLPEPPEGDVDVNELPSSEYDPGF